MGNLWRRRSRSSNRGLDMRSRMVRRTCMCKLPSRRESRERTVALILVLAYQDRRKRQSLRGPYSEDQATSRASLSRVGTSIHNRGKHRKDVHQLERWTRHNTS
jgi:hypothetical protein